MITLIATVDAPLQITAFSIFTVPLTRTAGISLNRTNASPDSETDNGPLLVSRGKAMEILPF